jgi:UDP-glucose 4-epimerase
MKLLIIGSKGFIGSHCVAWFGRQHEVWAADVHTDYNEKNFFLVSPANSDFHGVFVRQKFDFCINCSGAASVPDSLVDPARDYQLNVNNVFYLLEAIRVTSPDCKFLNLSSAAVYGNPKEFPISEKQVANPLSPYGYHKLYAEQLCGEYFHFYKIRTSSLRIFSAYGPGLKKQIFWDLFLKTTQANEIQLFGSGRETRDYIFIEDIMRGIQCILDRDVFDASVYNLASGVSRTIEEVSRLFLDALGWKGKIEFSGKKREGDPDFWSADISKLQSLGFVPQVSVQEGIKKYVKWLSQSD